MKVLLVNGSSRENGCTNTALNEVARALNENGIERKSLSETNRFPIALPAANAEKTENVFFTMR